MITKEVVGYEGSYTVREDGYIYSLKRHHCRGGVVKQWFNKDGYAVVYLCKGHVAKATKVHRIIAMAFIPNPENKPQVNHKNGNKADYSIDNLEWVTAKENIRHAYKSGLTIHKRGHEALTSLLTLEQRIEISRKYAVENISQHDLSKQYAVSQTLISLVVKEFIRNQFASGLAIPNTKQTTFK